MVIIQFSLPSEGKFVINLRRRSLIVLAVAGIMSLSAVAIAEHEDSHDEDTEFSFGYDPANHFLALNLGPNDDLYRCLLENGSLTATYGDPADDGVIPVESLEDGEGVIEFEPRPAPELAEGLVAESEPAQYTGADGECGVSGVIVAGPNGQINHGQFMKAAKALFAMKGHGCVMRHLAKSDLGKTEETKINTPDADPLFEIGPTGELTFTTLEADCSRGKKAETAGAEGANKGRPESPGKSGSAPGHNK